MDELVSKQAAINVLKRKQDNGNGDISRFYNTIIQHDIEAIEQLPSAQPEIVRCKDCNHFYKDNLNQWCFRGKYGVKENDFCSRAERRTDEVNKRRSTEAAQADVGGYANRVRG